MDVVEKNERMEKLYQQSEFESHVWNQDVKMVVYGILHHSKDTFGYVPTNVYGIIKKPEDFQWVSKIIPVTLKTKEMGPFQKNSIQMFLFSHGKGLVPAVFFHNQSFFRKACIMEKLELVTAWIKAFPHQCFQSFFIKVQNQKISVFDYFFTRVKSSVAQYEVMKTLKIELIKNSFYHNGMHMTKNILIGQGQGMFWNNHFEYDYYNITTKYALFFF